MVIRILAVLIVLGLVGGATFFLLRHDPGKEVDALRTKIDRLINSTDPNEWNEVTTPDERIGRDLQKTEVRIDLARKASDAIFKVTPNSVVDLVTRGFIEEYSGDLIEALRWFERASVQKNAPAAVEINRAHLLRKLGRFHDAKGAVSSIVDAYPFESNFELGRLHLDTFQARDAYRAFRRANSHTKNDESKALVMEGIADSLDLLISITRHEIERAKKREKDSTPIIPLSTGIMQLQQKRDQAIDKAIKYWHRIDPKTRSEFADIQLSIFNLISKKQDSDKFKTAHKTLSEAVVSDEEYRDFPIYLLLGYVDLKLAYSEGTAANEREKYIREVETNFRKTFSFNFNQETDGFAYVADWELSDNISREAFEAHLLLRVCRNLLGFPEFWRILSAKDANGRDDPLEICQRINTTLESDAIETSLKRELRMVRMWAFLKNDDQAAYSQYVDEVFQSVPDSDRPYFAIRLADGIVSFAPDHLTPLIDVLDTFVFGSAGGQTIIEGQKLLLVNSALELLNRARNSRYPPLDIDRSAWEKENEDKIRDRDRLTQKIRDIILSVCKNATEPKQFLIASKLLYSLVSVEESVAILREGKSRFPDDVSFRYALGRTLFSQAETVADDTRWTHYTNALSELVGLFKATPYDSEVVTKMFIIGARFQNNPDKMTVALARIARELFPNSSQVDIDILAQALERFLGKEFESVARLNPKPDEAIDVRPFLNLLVGTSYLEMANNQLKMLRAQTPGLTGNFEVSSIQEQFQALYDKARQEFENGLAIDQSYLPIRMDLTKMRLDAIEFGQKVPKGLQETIADYVTQYPKISPIHYLHAIALRKNLESLIVGGSDVSAKLTKIISQQRAALRMAIRADPSFTDAYLELAATYVLSWKIVSWPETVEKEVYQKIGSPEFNVAIAILESAPQVPKVLNRLATYYKAQSKPKKVLEYHKALFNVDPVESNVHKVIQSYIVLEDFEGARKWLSGLDSSRGMDDRFEVARSSLLAHIDSEELKSPGLSPENRKLIEDQQIATYRSTLEEARILGSQPPPAAVNNLAYLLSKRGEIEESLALIEPLVKKLRDSDDPPPPILLKTVEDTYAWIMHKTGEHREAMKIYQRLCSKATYPEIHMNYAEVLFDQKQFDKALEQIEIILKSDEHSPTTENKARQLKEEISAVLVED